MRRAAWLAVAAETGAIVSTVPCTISYQRTAPLVEVLATEQEETSRGGAEGQEEREGRGKRVVPYTIGSCAQPRARAKTQDR